MLETHNILPGITENNLNILIFKVRAQLKLLTKEKYQKNIAKL